MAQLELFKRDLGSFGELSSGLKLSGSAEGSTSTKEDETGSFGGKLDATQDVTLKFPSSNTLYILIL